MRSKKSTRIAIGVTCLVIAALVMGWFTGQYIPGEPRQPEPPNGQGLHWDTGYATSDIVDHAPGSALSLRGMMQGQKYDRRPSELETIPEAMVERKKTEGIWEYAYPNIDISIVETKVVATESIADLYPHYQSLGDKTYRDSRLVLVAATITNASDEPFDLKRKLPRCTLWSQNLGCIDESLGSGAYLDGAFYFLSRTPFEETPINPEDEAGGALEPGETKELVLPFKINKNNLLDQTEFDNLDPADFCLQVANYKTGTAHRLWL